METPTPYGFDLDPGEQIDRVIHRSVFDFLPSLVTSVLLVLLAMAFAFVDGRFPASIPFPQVVIMSIVALLAILGVIIFLVGFFVFRRNVLVFTNEHLVQVEQSGLFSHRVSQINFTRVQDVTGVKQGISQTIFNYGDVEIQSAGEQEKFIFHNAHDPQDIADDVLEIHEKCMAQQGGAAQPE